MKRPRFRRTRAVLLLAALATSLATSVPAPATAAPTCAVQDNVTVFWGTGYQSQITLTPATAVTAWQLDFDLADTATVQFTMYGNFTQSGRHVTITNASFNGSVAAGASVSVLLAINPNTSGSNVPPAGFSLNGQACAYTPQPYIVATPLRADIAEGGTTTFTVRLSRAPATNVIVNLGNAAGPPTSATPTSFVFTPADWNTPRTVTAVSAEDADTTDRDTPMGLTVQNYLPVTYIPAFVVLHQVDNDRP
ncbi:cellulose binding domain-containing protein [Catellatospora sp. TT07R-123]|uniref:cellulose binding domain-containing protein n=1 Tax=Catellatospora sp. TT07R-123 TaxID=2733863 RepID=UPI001BB3831F|nr:cellulose binding domain-containing protein [Catellatospora sp. TT07R-123]